jgi:serine/threonine-protein kinase RsbT
MVNGESRTAIRTDSDIVTARQLGKQLAVQLGFSATDAALLTTAISELARNILTYAGSGEVVIRTTTRGAKRGIVVVAEDRGPGIPDVGLALQDGYSTSRGLGLGLPGVRRLMDDFELKSAPGDGTTVTAIKWER